MMRPAFRIGVHGQEREMEAAWKERGRSEGEGGPGAGEPWRRVTPEQVLPRSSDPVLGHLIQYCLCYVLYSSWMFKKLLTVTKNG